MKSAYAVTSARMKPFSKSVWMTPAACGAVSPDVDRPRADLLRADGEVRLQAQQPVAGVDDAVEARLVQPQVGEEHRLVVAVEIGDLGFQRRADRDHRRALGRRVLLDRREHRVVVEAVLGDVGDVHRRLHREQEERLQHVLLLGVEVRGAGGPPLVEHHLHLLQRGDDPLRLLVAAGTRDLLVLRELLVDGGEVGQRELGVDRLDVGDRVDLARDVHDVLVDEAAHDVRDRVGLADVGEELVAQALALRRAGDEARDVDELDRRRHHPLGLRDRGERREARIGHLDDADVGLDRAERDSSRRRCPPWSAR